jgi:CheY-like chemotaxis protein
MNKYNSVWIIDDDQVVRLILTKIMEKFDKAVEIRHFESGSKALEAFRELKSNGEMYPEVCFLDIHLGDMYAWDFMEAYNRLGSEAYNGRIYITSASVSPEDRERAEKTKNVTGFLLKPVTMDTIKNI